MKQVLLIIVVVVLSACGGSKKVSETQKPKASTKTIIKDKDSNIQEKTVNTENDSSNINEDKNIEPKKVIEKTDDFKQVVKKRFIPTIHQLWDELLQKHVSDNGNVNYKAFKSEHKKLLDYIYTLDLLFSNETFKTLNKEEQLAFWINAYNAMTIDLILRHYPISSIKDIKKPWRQRHWKLNNKWYNLNEIEHQIIRKMDEPRIHFALVCAAISCPKLYNKAFIANTLENDLTKLTKVFLTDSSKNHITENDLKLSKIFKWFEKDFTEHGSLIDFLNRYSTIKISAKAKKSFKDYNWNLNE